MTDAEKKAAEEAGTAIQTKAVEAAKAAVETAVAEVKTTANEAAAEAKKAMGEIDKMAIAMARKGGSFAEDGGEVKGSLLGQLTKKANDNAKSVAEQLASYKSERKSISFDIEGKAAVDMLSGATGTGTIQPQRVQTIVGPQDIVRHVDTVVAPGTTNSNAITYVREVAIEGEPAMTAEGTLKPKISMTLETVTAGVKKIAAYFKVSEELLSDMPAFVSYLQARVRQKLSRVKDYQMLFGDNTGQNLQGISPLASTFSAGALRATTPNNIDVLRVAVAQVRRDEYLATAILVNPDDATQMELEKDGEGRYLLPTITGDRLPSVGRVPIIEIDAMPVGSFLVGAFDLGAQLFQREGLSVRVYDQNEDDAIKNMVTVVIEERDVQAVYRGDAFVKGTYASAKAQLSAA